MDIVTHESTGGAGDGDTEELDSEEIRALLSLTDADEDDDLQVMYAQNPADHTNKNRPYENNGGGGGGGGRMVRLQWRVPAPPKTAPLKNNGGTQLRSKTLWKGKGKERIDVENPNPSQRAGQVHYQDNGGNKYIYDPDTGLFKNAPRKVNDLLKDPKFRKGIEKGLKILGQ